MKSKTKKSENEEVVFILCKLKNLFSSIYLTKDFSLLGMGWLSAKHMTCCE